MEHPLYLKVGRLNKTFGLKGHIRAFISPDVIARLKNLNVLFLFSKNTHLPYFIDEMDVNESGHCMFHFEEINDKTAADLLVGKEIFIEEKELKKAKPYSSMGDYVGFNLVDETLGTLGVLDNMIELPNHDVGQFTYSGSEVLFPWNDQVVLKINKQKKEILLRLPEGLLDIYVSKK